MSQYLNLQNKTSFEIKNKNAYENTKNPLKKNSMLYGHCRGVEEPYWAPEPQFEDPWPSPLTRSLRKTLR